MQCCAYLIAYGATDAGRNSHPLEDRVLARCTRKILDATRLARGGLCANASVVTANRSRRTEEGTVIKLKKQVKAVQSAPPPPWPQMNVPG
jgi:hypothetical protein